MGAIMQRRELIRKLAVGAGAVLGTSHRGVLQAADEQNRKRVVRFAHLTDIHLYGSRKAASGLTTALRHVQSLEDPPEFLINGGDAIYDGLEADRATLEEQWALWRDVWKAENSLTVRHCLGNHDIWGWDKGGSKTTGDEEGWGKTFSLDQLGLANGWYDFEYIGWHFIVLDSMLPDSDTGYRAELGESQFDWLKGRLETIPSTTPVVVVSHIPILTVGDVGWSRELAAQPIAHKMLVHQDRGELLQLFRQHPNVRLCLSGHTHLTEQIQIAGITFLNSGAVSGLWWKGNNEHTDEGYNVIDLFNDGSFESHYTSYGWEVE